MTTSQAVEKRYAVRRTLDVRPEDYGTLRGTAYGDDETLHDAILRAQGMSAMGYRSRVVDTQINECVWLDGRDPRRPPRCPICGGLNPGDMTHTRCY